MVYVGDEAVVEPGGRTRRLGLDLGLRYEFLKDFYFQCDYTYSHARSIDDPKGQNYVPLARSTPLWQPLHGTTTALPPAPKHAG